MGRWSASAAVVGCAVGPWRGTAWRGHDRRYDATDHGGSLLVSGRWHRGADLATEGPTWPALYLALGRDIAIAEIVRQLTPVSLVRLRSYRFTELSVSLTAVMDCRDPSVLGVTLADLCHDIDWRIPQELAAAAVARGAEAILVPSATGLGDNLIVFPLNRRPGSVFEVIGYTEPRLIRET